MADSQRKTANLLNCQTVTLGKWTNSSGNISDVAYGAISEVIPADTITITCNAETKPYSYSVVWLQSDNTFISREHKSSASAIAIPQTFTPPVNAEKFYFQVSNGSDVSNPITKEQITSYKIMLNAGSTPLPYEPYWQHSLRKLGTATDSITTLPADVYADGNNATVGLKGNMSQSGTPTPQNPIQPSETGERTRNLFDGSIESGGWSGSDGQVPSKSSNSTRLRIDNIFKIDAQKDYTITVFPTTLQVATMLLDDENKRITDTGWSESNYQNISNSYGVVVTIRKSNNTGIIVNDCEGIIISEGSTAPSIYIPYGYKIPISSANTTTNVYLGEEQSTRKIKKLVLTGEESWNKSSSYQGSFYARIIDNDGAGANPNAYAAICSHAIKSDRIDAQTYVYGKFAFDGGANPYNLNLFIGEASWSKDDFKAYLAAQYANGTPVCVWYVLAEPTTGIVNEPIRKIGDYADTVSGISVPTITGADSFDVLTTLKPSEVELTYTGWHDASVKEWDGSEWQ